MKKNKSKHIVWKYKSSRCGSGSTRFRESQSRVLRNNAWWRGENNFSALNRSCFRPICIYSQQVINSCGESEPSFTLCSIQKNSTQKQCQEPRRPACPAHERQKKVLASTVISLWESSAILRHRAFPGHNDVLPVTSHLVLIHMCLLIRWAPGHGWWLDVPRYLASCKICWNLSKSRSLTRRIAIACAVPWLYIERVVQNRECVPICVEHLRNLSALSYILCKIICN